jgi:hypothetical protein
MLEQLLLHFLYQEKKQCLHAALSATVKLLLLGAKNRALAGMMSSNSNSSCRGGQATLNSAKRQAPKKALESEKQGAGRPKQAENILIPMTAW